MSDNAFLTDLELGSRIVNNENPDNVYIVELIRKARGESWVRAILAYDNSIYIYIDECEFDFWDILE